MESTEEKYNLKFLFLLVWSTVAEKKSGELSPSHSLHLPLTSKSPPTFVYMGTELDTGTNLYGEAFISKQS